MQGLSMPSRKIYCCGCQKGVKARLTNGSEIYPSRPDLAGIPFWRCDACRNYVGCHHKIGSVQPLGNIPTPELRNARKHIHAILDPIWRSGRMSRSKLYRLISSEIGRPYHTADLRTVEEARDVWRFIRNIKT